jgi:uncharacterized protein
MSPEIYLISAASVLIFSGVLAMAGLGAAFIFVPLFYYLGVPIGEAVPTALLLNVVSLAFAAVNYQRGGLVNWRLGLPILVAAVVLAPLGAHTTPFVDKRLFLGLFAAFLVFAGFMMLFYHPKTSRAVRSRRVEAGAGAAVGAAAGFLGGLLGVGGGNFIVPVLTALGIDAKVAAGTTAVVVVFSSLSGFFGHVSLGHLSTMFLALLALMSAVGSIAGSSLMKNKMTSGQLKKIIGVLLWVIAAKMIFDLVR